MPRHKIFVLLIVPSMLIFFLCLIAIGCSRDNELRPGPGETESDDGSIMLATTTSTYDSGLLDYLNPVFTEQFGIKVFIIAQGTGAALESGSRGDADLILVHDRESELIFVNDGIFIDRYDLMYNDFIIVGPADDPAGISDLENVIEVLNRVADKEQLFISRGDDSGTNRREKKLWELSNVNTEQTWYLSIGQGMSDTLIFTNETLGYTLTDRGTYAAIKDRLDLMVLFEGDPLLFNQYGIMAVNPEIHPHVKYEYALTYINFLVSEEGQNLIASYSIDGETLFYPGFGLE